jgi:hypothetical protein
MGKRWKGWRLLTAATLFWLLPGVGLAAEGCPVCGAAPKGASFVVTTEGGKKVVYGCAKCALLDADMKKAKDVQVTDFMSRTLVDARKAFYVKDSSYGECCGPYWLAFSEREHAERFAKGFGGAVLSYEKALEEFGK